MNSNTLIRRNWRYFLGGNLALAMGVTIATAVVVGALLVGDSVKYSLATRAMDRLGEVDYALVCPMPVNEEVAKRLGERAGDEFATVGYGLQLPGGIEGKNGAMAARVMLRGVDGMKAVKMGAGEVSVSGELARVLSAKAGDEVNATLPRVAMMPGDAAFARRSFEDIAGAVQGTIKSVEDGRGFADLFSLEGSQRAARNAWVNLRDLQRAADLPGKINLVLMRDVKGGDWKTGAEKLNAVLKESMKLGDYGLSISPPPQTSSNNATPPLLFEQWHRMNSATTYIAKPVLEAVEKAGKKTGVAVDPVSVYLANTLEAGSRKAIHYAMMASVSSMGLLGDEVAVNQWAADRLGVKVGDVLTLEYYKRDAGGNLVETKWDGRFVVKLILPMEGLGCDATLVPDYKGLTDAKAVKQWDPPEGLKIRDEWVTADDEAYWSDYKAAPKVFVSMARARELWGRSFGEINSVRLKGDVAGFEKAFLEEIKPGDLGMGFVPIKGMQLMAAVSGTDFSGLFIGFSFFLIASAVLLTGMLFKLQVQRRGRQLGLLGAMGFTTSRVVKLSLMEAIGPTMVGGVLGMGLGVGFTAWMIRELGTRWIAATGTDGLRLFVTPGAMGIGFGVGIVISMGVMAISAWRIRRQNPASLLAGGWDEKTLGKKRKWKWVVGVCVVLAMGLIAMGGVAALGGGGVLMVGMLLGVWGFVRRGGVHPELELGAPRIKTIWGMGRVNAMRKPSRTVLSAALIALASFTLVVTSAFQRQDKINEMDRPCGTGGYQIWVRTDIPLMGDLRTEAGRRIVGVTDLENPLWKACEFVPMRAWEGQDASCLNMTQPTMPTILGFPDSMINGMEFTSLRGVLDTLVDENNAVGEAESMEYILKLPVGGKLAIRDQLGEEKKLKLSAVLHGSIFQGELLVSESSFLKLFPGQSGFSRVLVRTPAGKEQEMLGLLRKELKDYSVEARRTSEVIESYHAVANAYLGAFELLGTLGLLLGTLGLSAAMLQGMIEQRGELALMSAIGFSRVRRFGVVFGQNILPLVLGLGIGAVSAGVGIWPAVMRSQNPADLRGVGRGLGLVLLTGIVAVGLPLLLTGRNVTWGDLRRE